MGAWTWRMLLGRPLVDSLTVNAIFYTVGTMTEPPEIPGLGEDPEHGRGSFSGSCMQQQAICSLASSFCGSARSVA